MSRVYLAARYSRREEMADVAGQLRERGHEVTSRWHEGDAHLATEDDLLGLYRDLLRTRLHDIGLKRWVKTGVISKAWLGTGEEAVTVGSVAALEGLSDTAKKNNPELKVYRYAIEKGKAAYDLAANEFMPDFTVKFKQMVKRDRVDENAWAGMLGVTIPVWFFQKQVFGVKEMKSELEMLKAEYKMKENMVLFDVRDAHARVEANMKVVELYETAFIPQANETVAAALRGYESGKADFLTLLDSQRMLIEFKLDHYNAILDLRVALADLERAVGVDLENKKEVRYETK